MCFLPGAHTSRDQMLRERRPCPSLQISFFLIDLSEAFDWVSILSCGFISGLLALLGPCWSLLTLHSGFFFSPFLCVLACVLVSASEPFMSPLFFTVYLRCGGIEYLMYLKLGLSPPCLSSSCPDYKEDASKGSEAHTKPCSGPSFLLQSFAFCNPSPQINILFFLAV